MCWFSFLNAKKTNTFRSVFLSNLGFNSGVFLSTGYRRSDWVATQPPLEQPLKNIMRGKKPEIHGSQKTLWSQPTSKMQLLSIEVWFVRNLWRCTLDEWRHFHFWPTRVSKTFLFAPISSILWRFKSLQCYCSLIAMSWNKPKTAWNKLTYILVAYWYQPPSIDPPLYIAPHFSESAGFPVRIRHCLRRQLVSHSSFQYSVSCPSSPSYWPVHLPVKQKYIWPYYGGPQLSRQNQKPHGKNKIPHGKTKNLTTKPNTSQQKQNRFGFAVGICFCREVFGFCCEVFGFSVRFLVLSWGILFLT